MFMVFSYCNVLNAGTASSMDLIYNTFKKIIKVFCYKFAFCMRTYLSDTNYWANFCYNNDLYSLVQQSDKNNLVIYNNNDY